MIVSLPVQVKTNPHENADRSQRNQRPDLFDGGLVPFVGPSAKSNARIAKAVALLMPGPDTPGFDLCGPRSFQIWLALVHHAARHGHWCCPDHLPPGDRYEELRSIRPSGLAAKWTVEQLAHACGVDARSVQRHMAELRDLGWLRWSRLRDEDGQYTGILYVMQIPPAKLTDTATHRYRHDLEKKRGKLSDTESRIKNWRPDLFVERDCEPPLTEFVSR